MEVVAVIAVIWGVAFAIVYATRAVGRTIADGYNARVAAARKRFGGGGSPEGAGTKIGNGLAAAFISFPMWLGALRRGWAAGWREGRTRAHERFGDVQPEPAEPEIQQPEPNPAAAAQTPQEPASGNDATAPGQPETPAEPVQPGGDGQTQPVPSVPAQPVFSSGGNTMPIATTTGGEVTSVEQALVELQQIRSEAAANLEDAQADAKRAEEDARRIELFAASMTALKFGARIIAGAHAMNDTATQTATAAKMRAAAADQRLGQVGQLISLMQQHQTIQDIGASVGGVAERQAY